MNFRNQFAFQEIIDHWIQYQHLNAWCPFKGDTYKISLRTWTNFFFYQGFVSQILTIHRTPREGDHLLFHSTISPRSRTLKHLFATLYVRWLSRIFNRNACVYQTASPWDLQPYRITIWLIEWWCNVCLFTWWIDFRFLLLQFEMGNRWTRVRIDYHPGITSEPINQVC